MGGPWWMGDHLWRETASGIVRHCWRLWAENGAEDVGGAQQAMWTGWRWARMWGTGMWTVSGRARVLRCATRVSYRATCSVPNLSPVLSAHVAMTDSPWARVVRRRKSCLPALQSPPRHRPPARSQSVPRLVSRQSRRSRSHWQSHLCPRCRSHSHPHSRPACPALSWGWSRSGTARPPAGTRRGSCTGRGCRRG